MTKKRIPSRESSFPYVKTSISGINGQILVQPVNQFIRVHAVDSTAHLQRLHLTDWAALQCMPYSIMIGAVASSIARTSPMFIFFVIFVHSPSIKDLMLSYLLWASRASTRSRFSYRTQPPA